MAYVDLIISPVRKDRLEDYRRLAKTARAMWLEAGAQSYDEYIGDDVPYGKLTSLPRAVQATEDEIIAVSWITYASREDRDAINAKVEANPQMASFMDEGVVSGPRMIFGGFVPFLGASET